MGARSALTSLPFVFFFTKTLRLPERRSCRYRAFPSIVLEPALPLNLTETRHFRWCQIFDIRGRHYHVTCLWRCNKATTTLSARRSCHRLRLRITVLGHIDDLNFSARARFPFFSPPGGEGDLPVSPTIRCCPTMVPHLSRCRG